MSDLNRPIAELLGWTALRLYSAQPNVWWGLPPGVTEAGLYDENVKACPDWHGSVDAMLAELPDTHTASTYPGTNSPFEGFIDDTTTLEFGWVGEGATRAEALAAALLAWAEARNADAGKGTAE